MEFYMFVCGRFTIYLFSRINEHVNALYIFVFKIQQIQAEL